MSKWWIVTHQGRQVVQENSFADFQKSQLLPKALLHAQIARRSWADFLKGDYDIAVRTVGGFDESVYGTTLMRRAFAPEEKEGKKGDVGPLTDRASLYAEQESISHLFAGSIGSYTNPPSHRDVDLSPQEAAEMLVLASHLLRIVASRNKQLEQD